MSPQSGAMLLEEIAPRLRSAIPKVVMPVGAEDAEELVQDAIVTAARMLQSIERTGKTVTAGNIAYYTILHMKSGRRSRGCGRTDALDAATQLDHKSSVLSLEEEVGYDPELDDAITLGDLLATEREDPSMVAARNIDWDLFLSTHDYRYGVIVTGIIEGRKLNETARGCGAGYSRIYQLKEKLAKDLREFMGSTAMEDCARIPSWRGNLVVDREKAACQADRRRGR